MMFQRNQRLSTNLLSNFKYLRALKLRFLPLTTLPNSFGALKHLKDLDLSQCRGLQELPRSFYKLPSLQSLNLEDTGLKQLPDSVQRMFTTLPDGMQYLKSLQTLVLFDCAKLVSLPRSLKFLSKLENLKITSCRRINLEMDPEEEEDYLQLSLKTFSLFQLRALRDLPRLLLQGSSLTLQQIQITWCRQLSVLPAWLLNLTSLQELRIDGCKNLLALPEGIGRLTNLRQLTIVGCPQLSKRYRQNEGEDWHKIAHIQKVHIHHVSADEEASTDAEFTDED
ncbi:hypothetical protein GOBAR_DD32942 [Gossypium barbadense]|nr:hypothetical protein GOBAR_DD32942 [Gossypium barbadense]